MKISLEKWVRQGQMLPFGYGIAWYRSEDHVAICYPVPINWIIWILRELWIRLIITPKGYVYSVGKQQYADGWIHGYYEGRREILEGQNDK